MKEQLKKIMAIILVVVMVLCTTILEFPTFSYAVETETVLERISNPTAVSGETDGLEDGGNRETSYAWAMAERGDYLYIGTNKNIMGTTMEAYANAMISAGLPEDTAWAIINNVTNGEIPRPTTTEGGYIFKCNKKTGEFEKIYIAGKDVSFRMAIEFEDNLYFGSYSAESGADNYIYKIDNDDNITVAFTSKNGTSMRAACIYDNSLYFGGVDDRIQLDEGDEDEYAKCAIIKKDQTDDTKWDRVADYKDFGEYATDPAVKSTIASPIWDICTYGGYIWATIPNTVGGVVYKGHPAAEGEQANEYGWYWTEVVGKNNGINNIGLADTSEGYINEESSMLTMVTTPFVFKDKLYMIDFDNTIQAEVSAITGLMKVIAGNNADLAEDLEPMYITLNHPQSLWCYDDATGKFNIVDGFTEYMTDNCNEYLWRAEVYNDELYITTMDSAVMYKYILQFTGKNFTSLTEEEMDDLISKINQILTLLGNIGGDTGEFKALLETMIVMIEDYKEVMDDKAKFNQFLIKYEDSIIEIENLLKSFEEQDNESTSGGNIVTEMVEAANKVNWKALRIYAYLVRIITNDTQGFDMLKTSDGQNFELVTNSGFDDPYNYGGRSLCATNEGLFIGTANPFYGAQLWRISEKDNEPGDNEPGDNEPGDNEPGDNEPGDNEPGDNEPGDNEPGDNEPGDNKPGDNEPGDNEPGDNEPGDNEPGDNEPGDNKPGDNGGNTEIPDVDLDELRKELEDKIENVDKLTEELEKLKDDYTKALQQNNSAKNDPTLAPNEIPKAGDYYKLIPIGIVVIAIGAFALIKNSKYRDIK